MIRRLLLASLIVWLPFGGAVAMGAERQSFQAAVPDDLIDAWERFQRALQEWGGRVRERLNAPESREVRPLISIMLNNKERLGLSNDQVRKMEQLRDAFQRQSIRNEADLRIVELDIAALLESDPVDMAKLEAKIREAEKLRADLRLARVRAIEQAKNLLHTDQKKKLQEIVAESYPPPPRRGVNPPAKE